MDDDLIDEIKQRARKNFGKGYNCAESVFEAIISSLDTGLPKDTLKLATGFGGGIGLYGDTCGAITGAVMAVGAVHGRDKLPEGGRKEAVQKAKEQLYGKTGLYRIFNQIPNRINDKYGNTLCRELTKQWKDSWLCREHMLHCRDIITDAAGIAAKLILSDKDTATSKPFGRNVENLKD